MPTSCSSPSRSRHGRLLVECLVAMLLLNATTVVVASLAHGASRAVVRARQTTVAWSLATRQVEAAADSVCVSDAIMGASTHPPLLAAWQDEHLGGWTERRIAVTAPPSPWHGDPLQLAMRAAWSCP